MPGRGHTPLRVAFRRPWPATVRGRILWIFAVVLGLKGLGYVFGSASASTDASMRFLTQWAPLDVWGLLVVSVCVFAAVCSYCHHGRDKWGYDALTALSSCWSGVYLASLMILGSPGTALQGCLSMTLIATALVLLRRLRDVRDEARRNWR